MLGYDVVMFRVVVRLDDDMVSCGGVRTEKAKTMLLKILADGSSRFLAELCSLVMQQAPTFRYDEVQTALFVLITENKVKLDTKMLISLVR